MILAEPNSRVELRAHRTIDSLPGPKGYPLVKNALQIKNGKFHEQMKLWQSQHGPVFRFNIPGRQFVVTSDFEMVHTAMNNRPNLFRRVSSIEAVLREMGMDGLFAAEGDKWRRHRKLTNYAFNSGHLRNFFDTLMEITARLHRRTESIADSGEICDVQRLLMRFTVDVTTKLAFGVDMNTIEKEGNVIQQHLDKIFPAMARRFIAPFPYWRYFKLPEDRELDKALRFIRKEIGDIVSQVRDEVASHPEIAKSPRNLLEAMLTTHHDGPPITDDEIFANVGTILVAGEDTTANTMAWMVNFMLDNPDVQTKMQAEADSVLGNRSSCTQYSDVELLSYTEAVAHETLRLCDITAFHSLEAIDDTQLGDLNVPKGTNVICNVATLARNPSYFSYPDEFCPERWLPNRPERFKNHNPKATMPFGGGPRFCPGRNLALLEIKTVMSMLLRHYTFRRPVNAGPVDSVFHFVVVPTNLMVHLTRR